MTRPDILPEIAAERARQDAKWGEQNHPDGTWMLGDLGRANRARRECYNAAKRGTLTYRHILDEEVQEAFAEYDPATLRAKLVQVAAVAVAWIECIDRRGGK